MKDYGRFLLIKINITLLLTYQSLLITTVVEGIRGFETDMKSYGRFLRIKTNITLLLTYQTMQL
jgi:hypothetical protein